MPIQFLSLKQRGVELLTHRRAFDAKSSHVDRIVRILQYGTIQYPNRLYAKQISRDFHILRLQRAYVMRARVINDVKTHIKSLVYRSQAILVEHTA